MPTTEDRYELYHYIPSIAAAAVAIIIFAILTILHGYRMVKRRMWFCLPFVVGGMFEFIGYIGRAVGHSRPESTFPYIVQSIFVLVAPALFAASIYMILGRIIRATHAESYSIIHVTWPTRCFVLGDVFTFFIRGGGGGIMASHDPSKAKLGQSVILGGLFLQILIFGLFVLVSIIFNLRLRKQPTRQSLSADLPWQTRLIVLYVVSALIMARNIVRVVEFIGGRDGPLLSVEWTIYVFDALLMAATMAIWWVWYPTSIQSGKLQPGDAETGVDLTSTQGGHIIDGVDR